MHHPLQPLPSHPQEAAGAPREEEIRGQLRRILASPDFGASPRNRRFLEHVVEESIAGRRVKGYEIGAKIFGRGLSFNATSDPIVRIEAGKLRRELELYYLRSGRGDLVQIGLAKGVYRAVFSYRKDRPEAELWPDACLALLRASLLGWSGQTEESSAAWSSLLREYPDLLLDPRMHAALERIHGRDHRVRELLLEGLRRAAQPVGFPPAQALEFARG